MIRCTPKQEPYTLKEFLDHLVRFVKFKDFETEGKRLAEYAEKFKRAVLVLNPHSVIQVKMTAAVGDMLLAEILESGHICVAECLSSDIQSAIKKGCAAGLGTKTG